MKSKLLIIVFLSSLVACSSGSTPDSSQGNSASPYSSSGGANKVTIEGFLYAPSTNEIGVGESVTWINQDEILHTVTAGTPDAPEDSFDGSLEEKGASFEHTFEEAGTFDYFCDRHNHMQGTITVS